MSKKESLVQKILKHFRPMQTPMKSHVSPGEENLVQQIADMNRFEQIKEQQFLKYRLQGLIH